MHRLATCLLLAPALALASDASLANAAANGDWAGVRALIQKHAEVNAAQPDGTTALQWAAQRDDASAARLLVTAGADVKAANRYGVTALSLACRNGNAEIVELLLKAGADPNAALPGGETPVMTAARTGNASVVKALIGHGAKVDAKETSRGQTAIMWAAAEGNVEAIQALIQAGADFRARLDSGWTPLLFAVREGKIDAVRALLKAGADVNDTIQPNTAAGRKALGFHGAPRAGSSALHIAVGNAHFELAAFLLDAGAEPNASEPGYTPLHMVTWVRKPGGGDNDPAPDGSGNMTSLEMVKKLVDKGADLNARMTKKVGVGLTSLNTLGATPFLLAARTADAELMRYLAKLGADPKIPTADNATPLIVAAGLGTRSPGEDAGTESEVVEALQAALDLGNDINAVDNNGETAMHGAAYKNLPAAVEFLAAHGANPEVWNRKNKHGWTPLIIAEGYRFGNYKPSPTTVAAFHRVMKAAGIPIPPPQPIPGEVRKGN
ncbi:MAG TPA: ankyrin repeat domain-containing protein [Bryobacteraceae bacterium]|jgi:ankyrin repeat protein